ncbi:hypothetical protein HK100_005525, partial [Physocladia obscura]
MSNAPPIVRVNGSEDFSLHEFPTIVKTGSSDVPSTTNLLKTKSRKCSLDNSNTTNGTNAAAAFTAADSNTNNGFSIHAADLAALVSPFKDHAKLAQLGSTQGILKLVDVNENTGLSANNAGDLARRLLAFGANKLPAVKAKSIFYCKSAELFLHSEYFSLKCNSSEPTDMLKALSDKIMILLSVVSLVSLGIGIYEDVKESDPTQRVHWIEGFSVLVAVLIVVLASSINAHTHTLTHSADLQKEKQFRKLNAKKEDRSVKGIRDGKTLLISVYDIVVGDILLLEPGDVIAADGVFISGMGLKCDESSATGETDAIRKGAGHDFFIVSGSKVTEGIGRYVVTSVGSNSFFGSIMMAMRTENEDTPLQVKLDGLAERIAKLGTAFAILLFVLLFLKYIIQVLRDNGFGSGINQESGTQVATQLVQILLVSIAIVAVAVPEGLPLAVTLALAYATTRMMKDNNLVRVLSACETMGNATTICSDKTGTLTQNRMTVVTGVFGKNVLFDGDDESRELKQKLNQLEKSGASQVADFSPSSSSSAKRPGPTGVELLNITMEGVALNSSAFEESNPETGKPEMIGSKTETALLEWSNKIGFNYKAIRNSETIKVIQVYPFSSERKSMATLVKIDHGDILPPIYRFYVKGAPEIVMKYCDQVVLLPFSPSQNAIKKESANSSSFSELGQSRGTVSGVRKRPLGTVPAVGSRSNPALSTIYSLDDKLKTDYSAIIESFAVKSLRAIGLAYRDFSGEEFEAFMNGSLRENVIAAKKSERQETIDGIFSAAHEGVYIAAPTALSAEERADGQISRLSTVGSSMLMIPNQSGETKSFIESHVSEDEILTDADVLSHPLAFIELTSKGLILGSIVGIEDPLRPGVIDAVQACKDAGVFVRMVTGDNVLTAKSIATQCGIYSRGGLIMEGEQFRKLTNEQMLEVVPRLQVLARSSPLDKQILVSTLKTLGETVAVTGDGTNDGPALKMADIGFSMGIAGTEVAKEASSIILMEDSFSSVVKAILWGRSVNDAVKKFLQFQLSVNISAVLITLISALVDSNESSALTVVQLLWINLIMDTLAALALATEVPSDELLKRPPESKKAPLISFVMWKMIIGQALLQLTVNLVLLFAGPYLFGFQELIDAGGVMGNSDSSAVIVSQRLQLKTVVFNTFVILQIFSLFNSRRIDSHVNVFKGVLKNPPFFTIITIIIAAQVLIIEFGGLVFQTTSLSGLQWLVCLIGGCLTIPWG